MIKLRKGQRKITIFRFLLAKLVFEDGGIHIDEFLVLFELYYQLKQSSDPSFCSKYGNWFKELEPIFEELGTAQEFPVRAEVYEEEQGHRMNHPWVQFLPSEYAYFGMKGHRELRNSFKVILRSSIRPVKVKPKAYVGVGYKDKGTRKKLSKDGSPSWQEVASHFSEMEARDQEDSNDLQILTNPPPN